jgi:hypothetical protein
MVIAWGSRAREWRVDAPLGGLVSRPTAVRPIAMSIPETIAPPAAVAAALRAHAADRTLPVMGNRWCSRGG